MDPGLVAIAEQRGVFTRADALAFGYDDRTLRSWQRQGLVHRVRQGAYCTTRAWSAAGAEARHAITARAVLRAQRGTVALSHVTAALEHGLPVWDVPLARVHVTRLDGGSGRRESDAVHHVPDTADLRLEERGDVVLTSPARCVIETLTSCSVESGLVLADALLNRGMSTLEELVAEYDVVQRWPDSARARLVISLANGGAESVGESRARYLMWQQGLPMPVLQYRVVDAAGELIGFSDFCWPERRLLGEFDGRVKYGRLVPVGQEPGDVVFAEKRREDRMREATGFGMVRMTWADLADPQALGRRLRRILGQQAS